MHTSRYQSGQDRPGDSPLGVPQMHMSDPVRELESGLRELGHAVAQAISGWGLHATTVALIEAHESLWEMVEAATPA